MVWYLRVLLATVYGYMITPGASIMHRRVVALLSNKNRSLIPTSHLRYYYDYSAYDMENEQRNHHSQAITITKNTNTSTSTNLILVY